MPGFEWVIVLRDQMTGAAGKIQQKMKDLKKSIADTQEEILKLQRAQVGFQRSGQTDVAKGIGQRIQDLRMNLSQMRLEQSKLSDQKPSFFSQIVSANFYTSALKYLAHGAVHAALAIKGLIDRGVELALSAREFREESTRFYGLFLDSAEAGEDTFNAVRRISNQLHMNIETVGGLARELLASGIEDQQQLKSSVEAISNLQRVGNDAAASKLRGVIEKSVAAGSLIPIKPKMLAGTGIEMEKLYESLAKKMKKGTAEIKQLLKDGKISVETGIEAITEAINEGKVGEAARSMFKLSDIATDVKNKLSEIFEGIDTSGFVRAMKNLVGLLDTAKPSGAALKLVMENIFGTLVGRRANFLDSIAIGLLKIGTFALKTYNAIFRFSRSFAGLRTVRAVLFLIKAQLVVIGLVASAAFALVIAPMLAMSALGATLWVAMVAGVTWAAEKILGFVAMIWGFAIGMKDIGVAIVSGIIQGITSAAGALWDAVKNLGYGALQKIKDIFGIKSPSREMAKLGVYTARGFEEGVESGTPAVGRAMGRMAGPPALRAGPAVSGQSVTIHVGGITISGVRGAEEIAPMLESHLTDIFERAALEFGGG